MKVARRELLAGAGRADDEQGPAVARGVGDGGVDPLHAGAGDLLAADLELAAQRAGVRDEERDDLADAQDAAGDRGRLPCHAAAVEEGSVAAGEVGDVEGAVGEAHGDVAAGDLAVVEDDVGLGRAPEGPRAGQSEDAQGRPGGGPDDDEGGLRGLVGGDAELALVLGVVVPHARRMARAPAALAAARRRGSSHRALTG